MSKNVEIQVLANRLDAAENAVSMVFFGNFKVTKRVSNLILLVFLFEISLLQHLTGTLSVLLPLENRGKFNEICRNCSGKAFQLKSF